MDNNGQCNYPTFDDVNKSQPYQAGGYNPGTPLSAQQPPYNNQQPTYNNQQTPYNNQQTPYNNQYPPSNQYPSNYQQPPNYQQSPMGPYPTQPIPVPVPTAVPVPVPAPMVYPNPMCPRCGGTGMILGGHPCSCVGGSTKLHTAEKVEVGLGVAGAVLGILGAIAGPHGPPPHGPHW